jgi:hypothetical protein
VTGNDGVVSGIEINANILASLLEHRAIEPASVWLTAIVNLIPVLLAMCCLLWLTPRKALIGTTTIFVLTVISSGALYTQDTGSIRHRRCSVLSSPILCGAGVGWKQQSAISAQSCTYLSRNQIFCLNFKTKKQKANFKPF